MNNMRRFEQIAHTADIKIRVYGKTKEELFKNALYGMFQSVEPLAPDCVKKGNYLECPELPYEHTIHERANDSAVLLVNFLSQALYFSDVYNEAYFDARIEKLTETEIVAHIQGVKIRGFAVTEIKAVTYHDLYVTEEKDGWQAEIVFDI